MILSKLCWLLLELVLTGLFLSRGSSTALALAVALLLLPLGSMLLHFLVRKRLRLHLEVPANVRKGAGSTAVLVVENPTMIPVLRLRCKLFVENRLNGTMSELEVDGYVFPKGYRKIPFEVGDTHCGRLAVRAAKLRLYDALGLFPVTCTVTAEKAVTVQPDTFVQQLSVLPVSGSPEDSELFSAYRPGMDLTETFQIREYVEGDSLRQIHWKLTGKFDRLIVRDPSLPIIHSILVFWERTGDSGDLNRIDTQAEVVITLCKTLLDQSMQFTMGWNDTREQCCVLQAVHDLDELVGLTPRILTAKGQKEGISGAELLMQTLGERQYSHIVYIGEELSGQKLLERLGYVTVLTCAAAGDGICFDPWSYEKQLAELAI